MTDKKKWSEIVLEERDKGNVVCILLPDEVGAIPVKEIIKQPVDGLLWDLNRSEDVCLSFMDEPEMLHWVNNFAVALVIRELHGQVASLQQENERLKVGIGAIVDGEEYYKGLANAEDYDSNIEDICSNLSALLAGGA